MTPQLAETLKGFPLYSQDGKGNDAVCCAVFALGSARWYILEGEVKNNDTILFGIVIGLIEDEYDGYVSLNELSEVEYDCGEFGRLHVRQQENFAPTPLCKLRDERLQRFLAQFEQELTYQPWLIGSWLAKPFKI